MFAMRTRKRGTMALLVLQTKDVPMNTLAAKVSRQRHLFARFASVCVLVTLASVSYTHLTLPTKLEV